MFNKLSIKNKIFFIYLIVIIISVLSIGFIGFKSSSDSYIDSALNLSKNKTETLATTIKDKLSDIPADIEYFSNFYALQQYFIWVSIGEKDKVKQWENLFSDALIDFMEKRKTYYKVRILDNEGNEKIAFSYNQKTQKSIKTPASLFQNKALNEYFQKSIKLKKGEFYISQIELNEENGSIEKPHIPVVRFVTPIFDDNGEKHGVFVANLYAKQFFDYIKSLESAKNSKTQFYLVNEFGDFIYNKDSSKLWAKQLKHNSNFNNEFPAVLRLMSSDSGAFIKDENIFSYNKIDMGYKDLYIISKINSSDALGDLKDFKLQFIVILFVILLIGYLTVRTYLSKITEPLKKVSSKLNKISRGEISEDVIVYDSKDEIGELVSSSEILSKSMQMTILQAQAVANGDFTRKINLLSENDNLGRAIEKMTERLSEVASLASELSNGNYNVKISTKGKDDKLAHALVQMINYLEDITKIAESISVGNLDVKYTVRSEKDRLGIATLAMTQYLHNILLQANAIAKDDFSNKIEPLSKEDELGSSLQIMTEKLQENMIRNREEIWFSEGLSNFSKELSEFKNINDISNNGISLLSRYVSASSGAVYIYDKYKEILEFKSSYCLSSSENFKEFKLKEGIIGQVAFEQKSILTENIINSSYEINSAVMSKLPNQIFTIPLVREGELIGVLEVSTMNNFTKLEKEFLQKACDILTNIFYDTLQNNQIKTLLEKSQRAFEELQSNSEELKASNEQMEEQAQLLEEQARSLKEQNEKLENAKLEIDRRASELKKSNEYKSEFLANMSHELRTPLNSIILLSSLLKKNNSFNLNEKDIEKAEVINQSGNELLRLINDILDLSKIEAGKMQLIVDEVDSSELLKSYEDSFKHQASNKGLEFKVVDNLNDKFYNDRDRLSQVVRNLISNALKFTQKGSITLELSKSTNEKLPIKLSLKDTGIGISEDKQEIIFKAFMQADGSTSRQYGGTGLGLSISKELTHLMEGEILLESKVNEGSTFIILLPNLQNSFVQTKKEKVIEVQEAQEIKEEQAKKSFLVIEDDDNFTHILEKVIVEQGSEIEIARNGKEGFEIANQKNIDGIILDLGLPDMEGMQLINKLKSSEETKNIPIQIISGIDKEKFDYKKFEDIDYLQKPVSLSQIKKAVYSLDKKFENIKSILIVEDDLLHKEAIAEFLQSEYDVKIKCATTVEEANKILEKQSFDLVIVDLTLPDGSGSHVCKNIKDKKLDCSVLIYTGRELSEDEADYLNSISDEIIIKNIHSQKRLKDEVKRFLNKKHIEVPDIKFESKEEIIYDTTNLNGKKVLIVDDDIKNIFVLSTALQESSMQTIHAKNGQEALDSLEKEPVDIILMDIMMPVMNGYEAIEAIRKNQKLKKLPIIAVTAKAMPQDKEKALDCGADDYLTKPIDLDKLIMMISMWLNKNK